MKNYFLFYILTLFLIVQTSFSFTDISKKNRAWNAKHLNKRCVSSIKRDLSLTDASSIVASGLVITGVVAVHEAGHFLAAKLQKMKINSFNIGIGPKLLAFNDSSKIEYAIRAIPLGGYVSFPSNRISINSSNSETEDLYNLDSNPDLLENRPPMQRLIVIAGGILANIALSWVIFTVLSFTKGVPNRIFENGISVGQITNSANSPGLIAGLQPKDVILSIDKTPLKGSERVVQDFIQTIRKSEGQKLSLEVLRPSKIDPFSSQVFETFVTPRKNANGVVSIGIAVTSRVKEVVTMKAKSIIEVHRFFHWELIILLLV